jgi:hypothetical protein
MTKYYAGIGSRRTPPDVLKLMTLIAARLADEGYTLRSGHADGADLAFEQGADGKAEIYLPWGRFNAHFPIKGSKHIAPSQAAMRLAAQHHPAWNACSNGGKLLHARNSHQILGPDLNQPVKFVICWTPDGQGAGGTGQALRIAAEHDIPIFDLYNPEHRQRLERFCAPVNELAA